MQEKASPEKLNPSFLLSRKRGFLLFGKEGSHALPGLATTGFGEERNLCDFIERTF